MDFAPLNRQLPIVLVTGFLGSGKTTLLKELLNHYASIGRRVAVVQNEFAQSSIDGDILREAESDFTLHELNTGSIFCACLFSQFKRVLVDIAARGGVDVVVVEATGIADPIAVAQLLEDREVADRYFLSQIVAVVDAPRFESVLSRITGVRHQIQVADSVLINKVDLVNNIEVTKRLVAEINPLANIHSASYAKFDLSEIFTLANRAEASRKTKQGELTKCGEGGFISKSYKSTTPISREQLEIFMESLNSDVLRLKGYVTLESGECMVVQYVPGQIEIAESINRMRQTELVAIGYQLPNFDLLN
ncbi:MAG: GTP-binding protein [Rikenellaceae bacterium]